MKTFAATGPGAVSVQRDGPAAEAHVAELEAEVAALRRALAQTGLSAEQIAGLDASELASERTDRAADAGLARSAAVGAEARHGREIASGRADLAASQADNEALRIAIAALAESRATLRESEERFRLLVGCWAQAVWETDADGFVAADSPSWRAYTGQSVAEWLGYGWLDAIHPDDRAYAERQWREAVAARRPVNAEFRLRRAEGGWRWTNVRAAPLIRPDGEVAKWVGMNIDITERKEVEARLRESEPRLRATQDHAGIGFHEVDAQGRYLRVNNAFTRMSGYTLGDFADRSF